MLIRIGKFDITECWDGVFYKKLSRYPEITAWEIQTVLDFIRYENAAGYRSGYADIIIRENGQFFCSAGRSGQKKS